MVYTDTTWVTIYWKQDQPYYIHRAYNYWFDEYNSRLSIGDNHKPRFLILQWDTEGIIHNLDMLKLVSCELDVTPTIFYDSKIITYKIELPPSRTKIGFNLLY